MALFQELNFWFVLFGATIDMIIILYILLLITRYRKFKRQQSVKRLSHVSTKSTRSAVPFIDEYGMIPTSSWIRVRNIYMN